MDPVKWVADQRRNITLYLTVLLMVPLLSHDATPQALAVAFAGAWATNEIGR